MKQFVHESINATLDNGTNYMSENTIIRIYVYNKTTLELNVKGFLNSYLIFYDSIQLVSIYCNLVAHTLMYIYTSLSTRRVLVLEHTLEKSTGSISIYITLSQYLWLSTKVPRRQNSQQHCVLVSIQFECIIHIILLTVQ